MSVYKYLRELWKKPKANLGETWKEHLIERRKEPTTVRISRPTRLDKARSLGYKAKQGFVIVRQKVPRGGRERPKDRRGRRTKTARQSMILDKGYQQVAEERANTKFVNLEILASYYLAKDGRNYWYEVILVDPENPHIKNDKKLNWIGKQRGRTYRGKTQAGRRTRGLLNKGKGAEKLRPSRNASYKRKVSK